MANGFKYGKVVIIDDDASSAGLLRYNLAYEGFDVRNFPTAREVTASDLDDASIVIVDAMKQVFSGLDFVSAVRRNINVHALPIIIYSVNDREDSIISALDAGADDYVVKPFSLREMLARVKSILRRSPARHAGHLERYHGKTIRHLGLSIDTGQRRVELNGMMLQLTRTEYDIFEFLIRNLNCFYTRNEIYSEVWKSDLDQLNVRIVDTNISRLRKKLGECGKNIVNRYGMGYGFVDRMTV